MLGDGGCRKHSVYLVPRVWADWTEQRWDDVEYHRDEEHPLAAEALGAAAARDLGLKRKNITIPVDSLKTPNFFLLKNLMSYLGDEVSPEVRS